MSRAAAAVLIIGAGAGGFALWRALQSGGAALSPQWIVTTAPQDASAGDGSLSGGDYSSYGIDAAPAPAIASDGTIAEGVIEPGGVSDGLYNVAYSIGSFFSGGKMHTSINGQDIIKNHEALRLTVYPDQRGLPTIGYGHLLKPGESFPNGINEEQAGALLVGDLATAENAVNAGVKVSITQNQFDALVSLAFNIGAGAFRSSTVLRKLNAGDVAGSAAAFALWNKVSQGGQLVVSAGLMNRRTDEANLFLDGATV